jgi:DNA-binding transcriptional LysR family regulator
MHNQYEGRKKMEIRHLRYFVAVAETLHFTRAAERLGIRQPPLSMQIKQLERNVGAALFRRLSRGVELTESGRLFLTEARAILAHMDRAVADAQRRARGDSGRIRVGFAGATYFHPAVPAAIHSYRKCYPDVTLSPEYNITAALIAGLVAGRIDVAFVRPPIDGDVRLHVRNFVDEELVVAVPAGHALNKPGPCPLAALSTEPFVLFPREFSRGFYDMIIAACHAAGFSPRVEEEAADLLSVMPMIEAGFGVSIVPSSFSRIYPDRVACRAIAGIVPQAPIGLAYRSDDRSATLSHFIAIAGETVRTNPV